MLHLICGAINMGCLNTQLTDGLLHCGLSGFLHSMSLETELDYRAILICWPNSELLVTWRPLDQKDYLPYSLISKQTMNTFLQSQTLKVLSVNDFDAFHVWEESAGSQPAQLEKDYCSLLYGMVLVIYPCSITSKFSTAWIFPIGRWYKVVCQRANLLIAGITLRRTDGMAFCCDKCWYDWALPHVFINVEVNLFCWFVIWTWDRWLNNTSKMHLMTVSKGWGMLAMQTS